MKHIKYYLLAMVLTCQIVSGCKESVKQETELPSGRVDSVSVITSKTFFAAPVGNEEYIKLRRSAFYMFTYQDSVQIGNFLYPKFIEPRINLHDFETYINAGDYEGIRIYPGYDMEKKHLVFIMCQANRSNQSEANYIALASEDYMNASSLPAVSNDRNSFKPYCDNYFNKVRILFHYQNDPKSPEYGKIRISRFYNKEEIKKLISDNITSIPAPYKGYTIKLEFGYIASEFVQLLQDRILNETYTNDQLQGFTSIMYIIDDQNRPMIEADRIYKKPAPGEPNNYYRLYLEVGSPCPPVCGELHND